MMLILNFYLEHLAILPNDTSDIPVTRHVLYSSIDKVRQRNVVMGIKRAERT